MTKNIAFILKGLNAYHAHIKPFIDNVPNQNYRFFIFHINKYYSPEVQLDLPNVTFINLAKEINYKLVISKHKIDVIISLNPGNIFDLFFLSICKLEDVTTVYYQHGIQLDYSLFNPKKLSQNKSISRKLFSLKKYIFFYSNFTINICLNPTSRMLYEVVTTKTRHLFFEKDKTKIPKYGLKNNHCDLAFVYGESDRDYLNKSMDMPNQNIIISGYPFLEPLTNDAPIKSDFKKFLYISSALRHVGVIPITKDEEKVFYENLYEQVNAAGYKLIIKIHPQEELRVFQSYFNQNQNVEFYKNTNLANMVIDADIVSGDYSTAMFYAIRYFKPLLIIESKFFRDYPFDFTKFGIGIKIPDTKISKTLNEGIEIDNNKYHSFLRNYLSSKNGKSLYWNFYDQIDKCFATKKQYK
tara:strand:+ start:4971 stop:6203 length:1233 start_codon:yes stop_codon:yes gene_type:complete